MLKEYTANHPVAFTILGLVVFYIGLKTFALSVRNFSDIKQLEYFTSSPYFMFLGGIICTLLWQSSSLSTTAIVGLTASGILPLHSAIACVLGANIGTCGTAFLASAFVSEGMPKGTTLHVAITHLGVNLLMGLSLLPFTHVIARFVSRF